MRGPATLLCFAAVLRLGTAAPLAAATATGGIRAQVDTVGFANSSADFAALLAEARAAEADSVAARRAAWGLADDQPWVAAIMPHDDYVYAGRTDVHLLPGLRARHWIILGVCHACRRLGVRDQLLFDDFDGWRVAGATCPVDTALRSRLLAALGPEVAVVSRERQSAEHSIESLLPWLREANPEAEFVPVLVPGMDWPRLVELAGHLAAALAAVCRDEEWRPGYDIGLLISADAVHYGCADWGPGGGYHPFGCDVAGHAAARAQDLMLAHATLEGPLDLDGPARFARLVGKPGAPAEPYRITWCGIYTIPFGLVTAARWRASLGQPPLAGLLLRYGDSVSDPRLRAPDAHLGVTAPANLDHWVGYAAVGYVEPNTPR